MRLLETDSLSNQNISSALSIASYTATALVGVKIRVLVNQVAGGGDYIVYATLTKSTVEYRVIPITTAAAAASLTSIAFVSDIIPLDTDDILQVYIDGLAGDTTTPDTRTDFYVYNYLQPATAGRTLVVDANGLADANVVKVGPTGSGTAQTAGDLLGVWTPTKAGYVDVAISSRGTSTYAGGAITGITGVTFPATVPSAAQNADAVWDEVLDTAHEVAGSASVLLQAAGGASDPLLNTVPGAYALGTAGYALGIIGAGTTATITTPVLGSMLTVTIGATLAATISGLTISASWTLFDFTLKRSADDTDANAILRIRVSNPTAGTTDGALIVEGAAATGTQRTLASLTVTQAAGTVAIAATAALTAALSTHPSLVWDLKQFTATTQTIIATGTGLVQHTPTWATA